MTISADDLKRIAWFECISLKPASAVDEFQQLAATVARIAVATDGVGFTRRLGVPVAEGDARDRWDAVSTAALKSADGTLNGDPLPTVAALWEVDTDGVPTQKPVALPPSLDWIADPTVVTLGTYAPTSDSKLGVTRRFRLFTPKNRGASMPATFTSVLTGTGLPGAGVPNKAAYRRAPVWLSCVIAIVAVAVFCWSAGCMGWGGKQYAIGVQLMEGNRIANIGALDARAIQGKGDLNAITPKDCVGGMALTADEPSTGVKPAPNPKPDPKALTDVKKVACLYLWAAAMQVANLGNVSTNDELLAPVSLADLGQAKAEEQRALDEVKKAQGEQKCFHDVVNALTDKKYFVAKDAAKLCDDNDLITQVNGAEADGTGKALASATAAAKSAEDVANKANDKASAATKIKDAQVAKSKAAAEAARVSKQEGVQAWEPRVFGMFAPDGTGNVANSATMSLITPLALMMASVLAIVIAAGLGVTALAWGTFISDQNRISLARCQVVAWSVLVLPAIVGFACFNAGVGVQFNTLSLAVFPQVPASIWAALGITIGSTLLSPLLLAAKDSGTPALQVAKGASVKVNDNVSTFADPFDPSVPTSKLSSNDDPSKASFSDLFLGEEKTNDTQVDISRLQMLVITVGLVLTYGQMVFGKVGEITFAAIAKAADSGVMDALLGSLPAGGATFTAMLAISHGAYIVTKAASTQSTPPSGTTPGN